MKKAIEKGQIFCPIFLPSSVLELGKNKTCFHCGTERIKNFDKKETEILCDTVEKCILRSA